MLICSYTSKIVCGKWRMTKHFFSIVFFLCLRIRQKIEISFEIPKIAIFFRKVTVKSSELSLSPINSFFCILADFASKFATLDTFWVKAMYPNKTFHFWKKLFFIKTRTLWLHLGLFGLRVFKHFFTCLIPLCSLTRMKVLEYTQVF